MQSRTEESWTLTYRGFVPGQEKLREALCTLGNGYMGTRGASCEVAASDMHYPGTYIAGLYNRLGTKLAGRTIYNEDLVNCPNWLMLTFAVDDDPWFSPSAARLLAYEQELDMYRGILTRRLRIDAGQGRRLRIKEQRLVHMASPHRAALRYEIIAENFSGQLTIRSVLDGTVRNQNVGRYRELRNRHWRAVRSLCSGSTAALVMRTSQSDVRIAMASRLSCRVDGHAIEQPGKRAGNGITQAGVYVRFPIQRGRLCVAEKIVATYTSRDAGVANPLPQALADVQRSPGFETLRVSHQAAWSRLWEQFDLRIRGDAFSQRAVRLHLFHLLQTASPHNRRIDAGLPARGLHGEAYRGHIFWDEMFVMPVFDIHAPEISRALLRYRYRRLAAAQTAARKAGYRGAMFPWQSGSDGSEETQQLHVNPRSGLWGPDYSRLQRHVSLAIAYNVWRHWELTRDRAFLREMGAELMLAIAHLFAGRAVFSQRDQRFHIAGVMGPDEFHERLPGSEKPGVTDNAYTNVMTVWVLAKAQEILMLLPRFVRRDVVRKLSLSEEEIASWRPIRERMRIDISTDGIISQFRGYFGLQELDWQRYRRRYGDIHRLDRILKAEGDSPDRYKVAKQADVLMMFYLLSEPEIRVVLSRLGYTCPADLLRRNFEYYVRRTSHGSTLSNVVHCLLAHRLGKQREAWKMFRQVLRSDIDDIQGGTTAEGIHTGVMAGSIDIVYRCFAGITFADDTIRIYPRLPRSWQGVELAFCYRGARLRCSITRSKITIVRQGAPRNSVGIDLCGRRVVLNRIRRVSVRYRPRTDDRPAGDN